MISFERCKKVLSSHGRNYTDDEIKIIVNFLRQLALFEYEQHKKRKQENGKGNHLHTGKFRRAG
jgi:hypothetical protein